jgi:hypothetical protein
MLGSFSCEGSARLHFSGLSDSGHAVRPHLVTFVKPSDLCIIPDGEIQLVSGIVILHTFIYSKTHHSKDW